MKKIIIGLIALSVTASINAYYSYDLTGAITDQQVDDVKCVASRYQDDKNDICISSDSIDGLTERTFVGHALIIFKHDSSCGTEKKRRSLEIIKILIDQGFKVGQQDREIIDRENLNSFLYSN